jgi:hypothetical protein
MRFCGLGSAACQPAFGSLPNATGRNQYAFAIHIHGKVPRTTGQRRVLPSMPGRFDVAQHDVRG